MRMLALVAAIGLTAAACSPSTTAGTAVGATTGAIVGGPVGAVVGAGVGAATGATAGAAAGAASNQQLAAGPGRCYVADAAGNVATDSRGRPLTQRC